MNGLDFIDGLSDVDMKYISEADEQPIKKHVKWQRYVSLAACFALTLISGSILIFNKTGADSPVPQAADGSASLIGSSVGLFWIMLAIGAIGMIISLVMIIKGQRK